MTKKKSDKKDIVNTPSKQVNISKTKIDNARYKQQNTGKNLNKC